MILLMWMVQPPNVLAVSEIAVHYEQRNTPRNESTTLSALGLSDSEMQLKLVDFLGD